MAVQIALGADIMMAFDECVETPASWERTRDSMALTHAGRSGRRSTGWSIGTKFLGLARV